MEKAFSEIDEKYELEIEKIVKTIKKEKAKRVLLQFPDGMKPYATVIAEYLKENLGKEGKNTEIVIWLGSCFGACDIPNSDADLLVQFGHAPWKFSD